MKCIVVLALNETNIIFSGMRLIEDQTRINYVDCIKFVPRTTEKSYIKIFSEQGCWSYVIDKRL
jgi:hypothetical protein